MSKPSSLLQNILRVIKLNFFSTHFQPGSSSQIKGHVLVDVACGKVKTDGIIILLNGLKDDLFCSFSEGNAIVLHVAHSAHDQPSQLLQFAAAFELYHHAVDVVQELIKVLNEQDLVSVIEFRRAAAERIKQG